jgi:hypothetical protein
LQVADAVPVGPSPNVDEPSPGSSALVPFRDSSTSGLPAAPDTSNAGSFALLGRGRVETDGSRRWCLVVAVEGVAWWLRRVVRRP